VIVADVNLVAYLVLGGPQQTLAERVLQRDTVWAAPLLWRSEFRSVLAAFMRQRHLSLTIVNVSPWKRNSRMPYFSTHSFSSATTRAGWRWRTV
jgi:hypothetical protein